MSFITPDLLYCLLIGAVSGVVAALCGVGGGIIMVPAFVLLLGLNQKTALATSLAAIILTSVAASVRNSTNNFVDWRVAIPTGIAAACVAWFASDLLKQLSSITLTRLFAVVVIVIGFGMLYGSFQPSKQATPTQEQTASTTKPQTEQPQTPDPRP
jgi:uncharacterized membrane protein YfcA